MNTTAGQLDHDLAALEAYRKEQLQEEVSRRYREKCSVCGRQVKTWSELEPGTGRCDTCQP